MAKAQIHLLPAARNTVMVVDDQSTSRAILEQVVRSLDDRVVVEGFARPVDAVVWAARHVADLVLVDYMMPDMDGIELVGRLRSLPGYEHVPIVMITGQDDKKVRYAALDAGITDFLTKPVDARECLARCRNLLTLRRQQLALEDKRRLLEGMVDEATREIREREKETLLRLARAGEFRDEETGYHLIRMARYSRLIANAIGLERDEAETIELAAPLHDIGKIGIPDGILLKPARLDEARMGHHAAPSGDRPRDPQGQRLEVRAHGRADRARPPRALRRQGLPERPGRRPHPAVRARGRGRRRLRRAHLGAPLQEGVEARRGARLHARPARQAFRPAPGGRVPRHERPRRSKCSATCRTRRATGGA